VLRIFLPVDQDHRQDGAGLDGDIKYLGFFAIEIQNSTRKNQMPGTRYGKKLGESLDNAQDRGLEQQN